MRARLFRPVAAAIAVLVCATGCNFTGISDLSLPGGAAFGSPTYQVNAVFDNVLDLVPQSAVRVNDVAVGSVD
jgi:phospholipid/cholesterol/gamma-HCH transport system substrate-binding protein